MIFTLLLSLTIRGYTQPIKFPFQSASSMVCVPSQYSPSDALLMKTEIETGSTKLSIVFFLHKILKKTLPSHPGLAMEKKFDKVENHCSRAFREALTSQARRTGYHSIGRPRAFNAAEYAWVILFCAKRWVTFNYGLTLFIFFQRDRLAELAAKSACEHIIVWSPTLAYGAVACWVGTFVL